MPRPRKEIEKADFEALLAIQCSLEEVTAFFDHKLNGCSSDTIERWCKRTYNASFADVAEKKHALGRISLRRKQDRLAEKSAAMAIWLGKQYLGQRESNVVTVANDNNLFDAIMESAKKLNDEV